MREPRWDIDYQRGRQGELFVEDTIRKLRDGATVEVKTDDRALETGHVYIEYECRGRPSGLRTTESQVWAFVLGEGVCLFLPTNTLMALARRAYRNPDYRVECARGSHPTRGVVVPLGELCRWLRETREEQAA